nr:immunoglobulin heavy chain junction region [Mus musculus]
CARSMIRYCFDYW